MEETSLISKNRVKRGGYGAEYASNAVRLEAKSPAFVEMQNGRSLLVADHASGTSLPVIKLRVVDAFGNTVRNGISDSQMKVTVSSSRGIISGQLVSTADAGIVVFDSLIVTADPDVYTLTFQPEESIVTPLLVALSIRQCRIGEHNITHGKICSVCQPGFYGFDPSVPCQACESQAVCKGGASMVPKDGFWHSNPFSPQFHECLVPHSCSYKDREEKLSEIFNQGIKPVERVFPESEYPQCRKVKPCCQAHDLVIACCRVIKMCFVAPVTVAMGVNLAENALSAVGQLPRISSFQWLPYGSLYCLDSPFAVH